jgi:hypothetical protein
LLCLDSQIAFGALVGRGVGELASATARASASTNTLQYTLFNHSVFICDTKQRGSGIHEWVNLISDAQRGGNVPRCDVEDTGELQGGQCL